MAAIFDDRLLQYGPWQEFERNTARLLLHAGWRDPRIVGRRGDGGADVLAVDKLGKVWLFQCKFSGRSGPGKEAIDEVRNAGRVYEADGLFVVTSQEPTHGFNKELSRLKAGGLPLKHLGPVQLKEATLHAAEYAPNRPKLHEYQVEAAQAVQNAILEERRAQLVLATGLGKTVVVAEVVVDMVRNGLLGDGRILVLGHTIPLVNQLIMSFWRHLPKHIPTHRLAQGERPLDYEGITFATFQTMANVDEPPPFDLVVVDEAHHLAAPEYLRTLQRLDAPRIIGVTATPWRSDGVSLDHFLGHPVVSMGIKDGLAQGFLSEVDYRIYVDNIDWALVAKQSTFGYTIAQLNKKLLIPTRDEEAIREIARVFQETHRRRGIVFSPSQMHARTFASDLRRHGFSAAALTSDDSHTDRFRRIAQFASGRLQFLCVVDIFNEGIDVPDVDLLIFLRVTHSRRIFVQQLGRGLRTSPEKDNVVVLDFAADVRRVHAALDLVRSEGNETVERLLLSHAHVGFVDRSLGKFFYEWIADVGNIEDLEEDEVVKLPIVDLEKLDFPEPLE